MYTHMYLYIVAQAYLRTLAPCRLLKQAGDRAEPVAVHSNITGTQFTGFTGTKVTGTKVKQAGDRAEAGAIHSNITGTQFTGFTGTKVPILTQKLPQASPPAPSAPTPLSGMSVPLFF
jgi:hypothetical protein